MGPIVGLKNANIKLLKSYFFRFPKVEDCYYSKHLVYCSVKFRFWVQIELNTKSK